MFLSGQLYGAASSTTDGRGRREGYDTYIVPFGTDTSRHLRPCFATRSALTFGGMSGGQIRDILHLQQVPLFASSWRWGFSRRPQERGPAGAINYASRSSPTRHPPDPSHGAPYEHVVVCRSTTSRVILTRTRRATVQRCNEIRGVNIKITEVPSGALQQCLRGRTGASNDIGWISAAKGAAFEYLRDGRSGRHRDGRITWWGPTWTRCPEGGAMNLGIVVEVAAARCRRFDPYRTTDPLLRPRRLGHPAHRPA